MLTMPYCMYVRVLTWEAAGYGRSRYLYVFVEIKLE